MNSIKRIGHLGGLAAILFLLLTSTSLGAGRDNSRFYNAALLDDRRTVLFTYAKARYRMKIGPIVNFGGGQWHYTKDTKYIGLYDIHRNKTKVLFKFRKESGSRGKGNFLIRGTRGHKALMIRESRYKRKEHLPAEYYLLDIDQKDLARIYINKEMAELGMKDWRPLRLIHSDGSMVLLAYSPKQKAGYNLGHVWLRSRQGQYRMLTQYGSHTAAFGGDIFYYDHMLRTRHVLNLETGTERTISNREYADRVPDNICHGRPCPAQYIRVTSDGKGLELNNKIDGKWHPTPLPIDMGPLR